MVMPSSEDCLSVYMSVCLSLSVCMSVSISLPPPSVCMSVCLPFPISSLHRRVVKIIFPDTTLTTDRKLKQMRRMRLHKQAEYNKCFFVYTVLNSAVPQYVSNLYTHPPSRYSAVSNLYTHPPSRYSNCQEPLWPPDKGSEAEAVCLIIQWRWGRDWHETTIIMHVWDYNIGQGHRPRLQPPWIVAVLTRSTFTATLNCLGVNQVHVCRLTQLSRC